MPQDAYVYMCTYVILATRKDTLSGHSAPQPEREAVGAGKDKGQDVNQACAHKYEILVTESCVSLERF